MRQLTVALQGELATNRSQPIVVAAIKGLLSQALRERVNYVNAAIEAKERGIRIIETRDASVRDYSGSSISRLRFFGYTFGQREL